MSKKENKKAPKLSEGAREYEKKIMEKLYAPKPKSKNFFGNLMMKSGSNLLATAAGRGTIDYDFDPKRNVEMKENEEIEEQNTAKEKADTTQQNEHGLQKIADKYVIGITGNTGSGKTLVSTHVKTLGGYVIDADNITKELQEKGNAGYNCIVEEFGPGYLNEDGTLNRTLLASYVFSDEKAKKRLEDAIHPLIIEKTYAAAENAPKEMVLIDAALLFEANVDAMCDETWMVIAEDERRKKRIMERDNLNETQATARMESQVEQGLKSSRADVILENDTSTQALYAIVEHVFSNSKRKMEKKLNADQ